MLGRYLQLSVPRECGTYLGWVSPPDAGKMFIIILCWHGSLEEGAKFVGVIRHLGLPIFSNVTEQPLSKFIDVLTAFNPPRRQLSTVRTRWMETLHEETQNTLVQYVETLPPLCLIGIHHMHHHSGTAQSEQLSSFGGRNATFMLELLGSSLPASEDGGNGAATDAVNWVSNLWNELQVYGMRQQYPAFLSPDQDFSRSYNPQDWTLLMELKSRYDKDNFFKFGIPSLSPAIVHSNYEPV